MKKKLIILVSYFPVANKPIKAIKSIQKLLRETTNELPNNEMSLLNDRFLSEQPFRLLDSNSCRQLIF